MITNRCDKKFWIKLSVACSLSLSFSAWCADAKKCEEVVEQLNHIQNLQRNFKLAVHPGHVSLHERQVAFNQAMAKLAIYQGLLKIKTDYHQALVDLSQGKTLKSVERSNNLQDYKALSKTISDALPKARRMGAMHYLLNTLVDTMPDFEKHKDEEILDHIKQKCDQHRAMHQLCPAFGGPKERMSNGLLGFLQAYRVAHEKDSKQDQRAVLEKYKQLLGDLEFPDKKRSANMISDVMKKAESDNFKQFDDQYEKLKQTLDGHINCKESKTLPEGCSDSKVKAALQDMRKLQGELSAGFKLKSQDFLGLKDYYSSELVNQVVEMASKQSMGSPLEQLVHKMGAQLKTSKSIAIENNSSGSDAEVTKALNETMAELCKKPADPVCASVGQAFSFKNGELKIEKAKELLAFLGQLSDAEIKSKIQQLKFEMDKSNEWLKLNFADANYQGYAYFQALLLRQVKEHCPLSPYTSQTIEVCNEDQRKGSVTQLVDQTGKILEQWQFGQAGPETEQAAYLCMSGDRTLLTETMIKLCKQHFHWLADKVDQKLKENDGKAQALKPAPPQLAQPVVQPSPASGSSTAVSAAKGATLPPVAIAPAPAGKSKVQHRPGTILIEPQPDAQKAPAVVIEKSLPEAAPSEAKAEVKAEVKPELKLSGHTEVTPKHSPPTEGEKPPVEKGMYGQYAGRDLSSMYYEVNPRNGQMYRAQQPHPGWQLANTAIGGLMQHGLPIFLSNMYFDSQLQSQVELGKMQLQYSYNQQQYNMFMYNQMSANALNSNTLYANQFYYPFFSSIPASNLSGLTKTTDSTALGGYFSFN